MAQADVVTLIFRAPNLVLSGLSVPTIRLKPSFIFFLGDKTKNVRVISRGGKSRLSWRSNSGPRSGRQTHTKTLESDSISFDFLCCTTR